MFTHVVSDSLRIRSKEYLGLVRRHSLIVVRVRASVLCGGGWMGDELVPVRTNLLSFVVILLRVLHVVLINTLTHSRLLSCWLSLLTSIGHLLRWPLSQVRLQLLKSLSALLS